MEHTDIGKNAMFTGHRMIPKDSLPQLEAALAETIRSLCEKGIRNFISGAALGFDTLAAKAVCAARADGLPITLTLAIPCMHQDMRWRHAQQEAYAELIGLADHVVYTSYTPYYNGCMQVRNRYMVEQSSVCVAYFNGSNGGTASTWRMANRYGRMVINLCTDPADENQLSLDDGLEKTPQ